MPVSPRTFLFGGTLESNPTVVQELRAAAEDALNRGFAILICKPHAKEPWAEYSPHAVQSAVLATTEERRNIALKLWDNGHEANYGVNGGKSNLAIIDVDTGITDDAGLYAWMSKNKLPETLTIRTGRAGDWAGYHLYYSGAVPTTPYTFDNVVGEVRSIGAYVVGPGCYHPSGNTYHIIKDVPIASLPEEWKMLCAQKAAKNKEDFQNDGDLIPEGNRWIHLQQTAGKLKNLGLDEDAIYLGLKCFARTHCVNGDAYPDEKIRQLAAWASSDACDVSNPDKLVTIGTPDPEPEETNLETPDLAIDGDYLGDLARIITNGTFIPPGFARAAVKTIVGSVLDDKVSFPGWEGPFHLRHWTAVVSENPEAGKTQAWKRLLEIALLKHKLLDPNSVILPEAGLFSSGEHVIKVLAENDNHPHLAYFDEMRVLFEKASSVGSTLFTRLLPLYDEKSAAQGSITHQKTAFTNVGLSIQGNFIRRSFEKSLAGKGASGSGFLSRLTLEYSAGVQHEGDWDNIDAVKLNAAVAGIEACIKPINEWVNGGVKDGVATNPSKNPFAITEQADAKILRQEFQKWLSSQRKKSAKDDDLDITARLDIQFRKDLLLRAIFSHDAEKTITKEMVERSIAWIKHQLLLRESLYPIDEGNDVERFEKSILKAIEKKGPMTKAGVIKFTNPDKIAGGFEMWNRAWKALLWADHICLLPVKSDRGKEVFGFGDAKWDKGKGRWLRH